MRIMTWYTHKYLQHHSFDKSKYPPQHMRNRTWYTYNSIEWILMLCIEHSLSVREAFFAIPSLFLKYLNFIIDRGFVNTSAICLLIAMYWSFIVPFWTMSQMKWHFISMWYNLSWNIVFSKILIQLWLLHLIIIGSSISPNNLVSNFISHISYL